MKIYIDQSGKVEYTSHDTVVAFSNGIGRTAIIKSIDKRKIQSSFCLAGKPDVFVYKTFSALLYILLKDYLDKITCIVIDREYWGKESLIKDFLLRIIRSQGHRKFDSEKITFGLVGKTAKCHNLAISVIRKKARANMKITSGDIVRLVL